MKKMKPIEIVHSKEEQAFDRLADIVLQKLADREANKPETDEELSESVFAATLDAPTSHHGRYSESTPHDALAEVGRRLRGLRLLQVRSQRRSSPVAGLVHGLLRNADEPSESGHR